MFGCAKSFRSRTIFDVSLFRRVFFACQKMIVFFFKQTRPIHVSICMRVYMDASTTCVHDKLEILLFRLNFLTQNVSRITRVERTDAPFEYGANFMNEPPETYS